MLLIKRFLGLVGSNRRLTGFEDLRQVVGFSSIYKDCDGYERTLFNTYNILHEHQRSMYRGKDMVDFNR